MKSTLGRIRNVSLGVLLGGALLPAFTVGPAYGEVSSATMADFTSFPVIATESAQPEVIITTSNDHQLYFKAYDDYSDLDGDGAPDTTYKHGVDYYGYFDSYKCYEYDSGLGRFVPEAVTADKYCDGVSGSWSGNLLNWASMTRIDAMRKLWFGGKRVQPEPATGAVLERAYLPHDAHSFAKYYAGADIDKLTPFVAGTDYTLADADPKNNGVTFCNTTDVTGDPVSEDVTEPPLIKTVRGNYSLWASNERWQCTWLSGAPKDNRGSIGNKGYNGNDPAKSGIDAFAQNPDYSQGIGQKNYVVRVEACVTGLLGNENCKQYPSGAWKPIGLLQRYGDDDQLLFAMLSGTYLKNKSGGDLIRNMGSISDEVAVNDDGRFVAVLGGTDSSGNTVSKSDSVGIINTWSLWRIIKYRHGDGTYGTSGLNKNNCTWGLDSFTDGQCQNWGNPFAEIYLNSLRYLAGRSPSGTFRANDSNIVEGLNVPISWKDPLDDTNFCARLNVVNVNASVISYDGDNLDDSSDGIGELGATKDSAGLTDVVGAGEGIHGNDYFVGTTASDTNQLCTQKTVNGLGAVTGTCPDGPRLEGTYRVAGLAHWAHTTDIRSAGTEELPGEQKVDTYSVTLAPALPEITVPVPGSATDTVTILPACRNSDVGGNCALVDFKVVQPHQETSPGSGTYTGKLYVNWEDSEQGGDFDQDMWGTLEYAITSSKITVTTEVHAKSTPHAMGFGYVISGTDKDGFHAHSGINEFDYPDPTGATACDDCEDTDAASSATFIPSGASAGLLEDPLYYAAKWGGFKDKNDNDEPDLVSEWDEKDTTFGLEVADGIPDKYFFVTNPQALEDAMIKVFDDILQKTASGTAAAVVANTQTGLGAAYQALFEPKRKDAANNEVKWLGTVHALWIDEFGLLREDNPGGAPNGRLEDYNTDPVVEIFFDETERRTRIRRFASSDDQSFIEASSAVKELDDLSPIWNAREQLAPEPGFADVTTQRTYGTSADNGRYITTWIDDDLDGEVDANEQIDFESSDIDASNFGFFDVATSAEAQDLVDYIRGRELSGHRNRTIDHDEDGDTEVMRLGDIVHSTPAPVGPPAEAVDVLFGDLSYIDFRKQYAQRRQVVYVGANDGMLHAFNAGFFDATDREFKRQLNGETAHPLGAELWAYAPMNLLPHLKWLKDPDYTHVYYVDGKPRVFDAKIFPNDPTHPNGWGTVLVIGFRLGGGDITTDTAVDGLGANDGDGDTSDDATARSAFAVLDITDPEQPPEVLAEITHPSLAYTTSVPAVAGYASQNKWYLVFGSGPTTLGSATSSQDARLFAYEMQPSASGPDIVPVGGFPRALADANGFVGDPLVVDWQLDGEANTIYFGVVSDTADTPDGRLYKLEVGGVTDASSWGVEQPMLDPVSGQPFLTQPTATLDAKAQRWVFASTGRLLVTADRSSTPQQTLYGIIDGPPNTFAIDGSGLVDVTDAEVFADGSIQNVTDPSGSSIGTLTELEAATQGAGGWKLNYTADGAAPSQRGVTRSALIGSILFNPAFTPNPDLCGGDGTSELFALSFKTGTALDDPAVLGSVCSDGGDSCPESELKSLRSVSLGVGLASSPSVHAGSGLDDQQLTVVEQTSTGAIVLEKATVDEGTRSGEISWKEYRSK
ncbi:MAG: hypothetical protein GWN84_21630 [Gammaproteobacteria bacterium]|nr:hypothetical protein [Gammaproteobacteria bacterium]NIR85323.1 hypothetical protein [Gammaproteobacteria bacterium]NIR88439.1 hypothetical protein [Gammaproteobacteria bacterium]NIU06389.1 hypothetical protein [Gammaproteobacteria bacterium]NIV53288.1 hypothetical protein [Gammaproteobacteria bacterium]